jgi:hypothetical protein
MFNFILVKSRTQKKTMIPSRVFFFLFPSILQCQEFGKIFQKIIIIIIQIRKKIPKNSQISLLRKQTKLVPKKIKKT